MSYQINGIWENEEKSETISFNSQQGPVNIKSLPLISDSYGEIEVIDKIYTNSDKNILNISNQDDVITSIEKLGVLLDKNLISREEFEVKKVELLKKL